VIGEDVTIQFRSNDGIFSIRPDEVHVAVPTPGGSEYVGSRSRLFSTTSSLWLMSGSHLVLFSCLIIGF
jgi:hypothetical protein